MKDEIQAGLKNALERGFSLDNAVQSFISAGYNPFEVKEAANSLSGGVTPLVVQDKNSQTNSVAGMSGGNQDTNAMKTFSSRTSQSTVQQQTSQFQQPDPQLQPQGYSARPQMASQIPLKKMPMSRNKKIVIILIVVLLILIGSLVGLLVFAKDILAALK
jgi:hypothetical protein